MEERRQRKTPSPVQFTRPSISPSSQRPLSIRTPPENPNLSRQNVTPPGSFSITRKVRDSIPVQTTMPPDRVDSYPDDEDDMLVTSDKPESPQTGGGYSSNFPFFHQNEEEKQSDGSDDHQDSLFTRHVTRSPDSRIDLLSERRVSRKRILKSQDVSDPQPTFHLNFPRNTTLDDDDVDSYQSSHDRFLQRSVRAAPYSLADADALPSHMGTMEPRRTPEVDYWDRETQEFLRQNLKRRQPRSDDDDSDDGHLLRKNAKGKRIAPMEESHKVKGDRLQKVSPVVLESKLGENNIEERRERRRIIHDRQHEAVDMEQTSTKPQEAQSWIESYKKWFTITMHEKLYEDERAKSSNLHDAMVFLESITKGERKSLSYIPRGDDAKQALRFISLNKSRKSGKQAVGGKATNGTTTEAKQTEQRSNNKTSTPTIVADAPNITPPLLQKVVPAKLGRVLVRVPASSSICKTSPKLGVKRPRISGRTRPVVVSKLEKKEDNKSAPATVSSNNEPTSVSVVIETQKEVGLVRKNKLDKLQDELKIALDEGKSTKVKKEELPMETMKSKKLLNESSTESIAAKCADSNLNNVSLPSIRMDQENKTGLRKVAGAKKFEEKGTTQKHVLPLKKRYDSRNQTQETTKKPDSEMAKGQNSNRKKLLQAIDRGTEQIKIIKPDSPVKNEPRMMEESILEKIGKDLYIEEEPISQPDPVQDDVRSRTKKINNGGYTTRPVEKKLLDDKQQGTINSASKEKSITTIRKRSPCNPRTSRNKSSSRQERNTQETTRIPPPPQLRRRSSDQYNTQQERIHQERENTNRGRDSRDKKERAPSTSKNDKTEVGNRDTTVRRSSPSRKRSDREATVTNTGGKGTRTAAPITRPKIFDSQRRDLPRFQQQVERTVNRNLNVLYKFENYSREKINTVAKEIVLNVHKKINNRFTVDQAVYEIWHLFAHPTKELLTEIDRRLKKAKLEETNFDVNSNVFSQFQRTVFHMCTENLRSVEYPSQNPNHIRYVRLSAEYLFPQFSGEANVMINCWIWVEKTLKNCEQPKSMKTPSSRIDFKEDKNKKFLENLKEWLRGKMNKPIYETPDHTSVDMVRCVQQHLQKRGTVSMKMAMCEIVKAWTNNYFLSIESKRKPQDSESQAESSDEIDLSEDDLVVLDEVYSEDSDSDVSSKGEIDMDISDDVSSLSSVQVIDLF